MPAPYAVSSDLVSAWPAKSLDVAQYIDNYLPLLAMPQNAQTGTTYTLAATDTTKLVTLSNGSPVAVTLPLESTVAWATGTQLRLLNLGAGLVTIAGAVGVTITGTLLTLATSRAATLVKTGTNQWTIVPYGAADPGLVQVTPTSVANGTLVGGAVTFSAVSSVSLNGIFTSATDNYLLSIDASFSNTGADFLARMRLAGSDNSTASSYIAQYLYASSTTVAAARNTQNALTPLFIISPSGIGCGSSMIFNPAKAAQTSFVSQSVSTSATNLLGFVGGNHNVTTAYDGITLYPSVGNMTGTVRVYGMRN